jgi:hypothetical protein
MVAPSALAKYQSLVDALAERKECVIARRVSEGDPWPEQASHSKFNAFIATLTQEQRNLLAELLQSARSGGIHDALVVLSEKANLQNLKFVQGGEELPHEPYGTEIYYDWVARSAGDEWPKNAG